MKGQIGRAVKENTVELTLGGKKERKGDGGKSRARGDERKVSGNEGRRAETGGI